MSQGQAKRIRDARTAVGKTQQQVADEVGVSRVAVTKWEQEDSIDILGTNLQNLARAINTLPEIITGQHRYTVSGPSTWAVDEAAKDFEEKYDLVTRISGAALSAGPGEVVWEFEEIDRSRAFGKDWMLKRGLRAEKCKLWDVSGHSMEPTIDDGGTVLINIADRSPRHGKMFALIADDGLRVKRLIKAPDGGWIMRSDNPDKNEFPDEPIVNNNVAVYGKIVWRAGEVD